jgi:ankyrin repeat protein
MAGILQLIYEYGLGERMTTISYLISIGADVNWRNEDENTPLNIAAKNGDISFFKLLIDNGANPRFKNEDGESAIDLVPDSEKPAFIKLQNKVWLPTSMLVKSI